MLSPTRPLAGSEHGAALHLWQEVFETSPGYFERYYETDPGYQLGDTLGIWDGDVLVSAVHLCRRPVVWDGGHLLCGGIANVATLPTYRRQGLSRLLLTQTIEKMEQESFHFSLLGTGTHSHYAALGWELVPRPQAALTIDSNAAASNLPWSELSEVGALQEIYSSVPRPLQFVRSPSYFQGWVGWEWRQRNAHYCMILDSGYLVLSFPESVDELVPLLEWRAVNQDAELSLLRAAAGEAVRRGHPGLWLDALPQHMPVDALGREGQIERHTAGGGMIRNVSLPAETYNQVAASYQGGEAAWWPGDGF